MATLARFIGIDRYADSRIPDLAGATRDARAMCALFTDSIAGVDARAVVDGDATAAAIETAIADTLDAATEADIVVLMFAGHGTPDHRIVSHDSTLETIETSTLPMRTLAERFRASRAGAILCILDCCFSGDAPARVLGDLPASRDIPFATDMFSGEGRLLIAASAFDAPAYEHPKHRHGLLTYALMEVLGRGVGTVNVAAALAEVQEVVRAEAAAMGRSQTPVVFGLVSGGLTMPVLRRGASYEQWFPTPRSPRVTGPMLELPALGVPVSIAEAWADRYPEGLNRLQMEAVNECRVLEGESLLVVAPTSAGKTFVGELAAARALGEGRKAVFLLPYRALVNEKYEEFRELYGDRCGLRVVRCSGDYVDDTRAFINGKYDLAVLTFELFLALAVGNATVLPRIGLVVLDEAQFISNESRGIVVELILSFLRRARLNGVEPQLVALSATMGELNHFDEWLGVKTLITDVRPVPLEFGVLDRRGTYQYMDTSGEPKEKQLLPPHTIQQRGAKASSQDVVVPLVRQILSDAAAKEKILVFRNVRGAAEGCANYLANELGQKPAIAILDALPTQDGSSASDGLRRALGGGTAFHNTNLTRDERVAVERAFRDPDGPVQVLVATMTVAAGVNTPASTVIIVENSFPWEADGGAFTRADVRNMAGRAGRVGFRETGRAIMLAESPLERQRLFREYVMKPPEAARSSFDDDDVGTWVLRLLAQVKELAEAEVAGLLSNTYGGYLLNRAHAGWQGATETAVSQLVRRMVSLGLLERITDKVRLTLVGQACGRASLSLESCLRLIEMIQAKGARMLSPLRLMALVQALPEMDAQYTPLFKKGVKEAQWGAIAAQRYGRDVAETLQRLTSDRFAYWGRLKRAAILAEWVAGTPMASIEQRYSITPFNAVAAGDVRSIADTTRFHLRSAADIAAVAFPGEAPPLDQMETLLRQLELGMPEAALALLDLPIRLERGEYLGLVAVGVVDATSFWLRPVGDLANVLRPTRLSELERLRPYAAEPQ